MCDISRIRVIDGACPMCDKIVDHIRVESPPDRISPLLTTTIDPPTNFYLEPCEHQVYGFRITEHGIITEWRDDRE